MSGILYRVATLWRQVGGQAGRSLLNQGLGAGGVRVTSSSTLGNSSKKSGYFAKVPIFIAKSTFVTISMI
jgi:hypothetical protein